METVEVVIKIPKEKYKLLTEMGDCVLNHNERAIKHGTVLPKGHGRLIDADKLEDYIKEDADEWDEYALAYVKNASTIIEANKDGE